MFYIHGKWIALLTFPGVVVHELAHRIFCGFADLYVYETCYFRWGNPAGYVIHESANTYRAAFLISVAPFIVNTSLAIVMFLLAVQFTSIGFLFYWLGISLAMHATPSASDAGTLWQASRQFWRETPLALLGFPVAVFIILASVLSVFWFDLFFALALLFLVNPDGVRGFFSS